MAPQERSDDLYNVMTVKEVSIKYGVHRQTVHDAIREGYIPARQSGRTWLIHRKDAAERWASKVRSLALTFISLSLTAAIWLTVFA